MPIPWWVGSIVANLAIALIEYFNHTSPYASFMETAVRRTLPFIVVAQWGLWHSFSGARHWMIAWTVFAVGNAVARCGAVYFLAGNQIDHWGYTLLGVAVMMAGSLLVKAGLN